MNYSPDLKVLADNVDALFLGLQMTMFISVVAMAAALVFGLLIALMRISNVTFLKSPATAYIQFFRGIPQYVFLIWLYYGMSMLTGINFQPLQAGIIALSMQYSGYLAEIYRAGIQAIGKGQAEAAQSVGLSKRQTYQYVILPQAIRIIIPPAANMYVGMLKDSSLVSVIGVMDLMRVTFIKSNLYFRPFEFFTTAALIYVFLTFVFSSVVDRLEVRLRF
jgi:His/Glu/Gln/Arg/opine family amino acid ABC transporter permease subunit